MPPKKQASREQRQASLSEIEARLALLGLTRAVQQIGQLLDVAQQFVETGEAASGTIPISEIGRRIEYRFANRPDPREPHKSDCAVAIKASPGVKK